MSVILSAARPPAPTAADRGIVQGLPEKTRARLAKSQLAIPNDTGPELSHWQGRKLKARAVACCLVCWGHMTERHSRVGLEQDVIPHARRPDIQDQGAGRFGVR